MEQNFGANSSRAASAFTGEIGATKLWSRVLMVDFSAVVAPSERK
jgi:hypothetical protein